MTPTKHSGTSDGLLSERDNPSARTRRIRTLYGAQIQVPHESTEEFRAESPSILIPQLACRPSAILLSYTFAASFFTTLQIYMLYPHFLRALLGHIASTPKLWSSSRTGINVPRLHP
jgi:hypothetical protein